MYNQYMWYSVTGSIVIAIVFVIFWVVRGIVNKRAQKDTFESTEMETKGAEHTTESQPKNIDPKPTFFDAGSGVVMSGPEFSPQQFLSPWYKAYTGNLKNYYLLDDGKGGTAGLHFNQCSKSCCSDQYPLPFKMPVDSAVCDSKDEFVPTNYTCNNAWQDSGCVCMTKDQADFLGARGGNA